MTERILARRRPDFGQMCAKSAHLQARADQKCSSLDQAYFIGGARGSRKAGPNGVVENTPFIKCACQICTLHTFWNRDTRETYSSAGF
jgi:hypothetical protein